jgi:hypothetical protein
MDRLRVAGLALVAGLGGAGAAAVAAPADGSTGGRPPEIRVLAGRWGDADPADIRAVLESAAAPFLPHFAGRAFAPILVSRGTGGPITLYDRGPAGETRVKLDVDGSYWAQFAYQFSHELGHVLCRLSRPDDPEDVDPQNFWLEESLCETASLFALRAMAKAWAVRPPHPSWKGYAGALARYAEERMARGRLPEGTTLPAWFAGAEPAMRRNAELREKNAVVAVALLPLLEEDPSRWAAVAALPRKPKASRTLKAFLDDWRAAVPEAHRAFVGAVGDRLGIGK